MITDEERREMARRLREAQADVIPGTKTEVLPIAGRIIDVACGYDLPDFQGLLGRLADLIEPSCDRDALLELADEMGRVRSRCGYCNKESDCDWADETVCLESNIDDYARRIREALGADS